MAKKVHLRLTGRAEKFIEYMAEQGLTERDVIAKALWLLETAWKTQRVALLNNKFQVEYIFTSQTLAEATNQNKKSHEGLKEEKPAAIAVPLEEDNEFGATLDQSTMGQKEDILKVVNIKEFNELKEQLRILKGQISRYIKSGKESEGTPKTEQMPEPEEL